MPSRLKHLNQFTDTPVLTNHVTLAENVQWISIVFSRRRHCKAERPIAKYCRGDALFRIYIVEETNLLELRYFVYYFPHARSGCIHGDFRDCTILPITNKNTPQIFYTLVI